MSWKFPRNLCKKYNLSRVACCPTTFSNQITEPRSCHKRFFRIKEHSVVVILPPWLNFPPQGIKGVFFFLLFLFFYQNKRLVWLKKKKKKNRHNSIFPSNATNSMDQSRSAAQWLMGITGLGTRVEREFWHMTANFIYLFGNNKTFTHTVMGGKIWLYGGTIC